MTKLLIVRPRSWVIVSAIVWALLCINSDRLAARPPDQSPSADYEKLHEQAKALTKEGDALLKAHKPLEARVKYLDASKLVDEPDIEIKQAQVEQEINKNIKKLLEEAEKSYKAQKYDAALAKLEEARKLREGDPTVLYNVALARFKTGDRHGAVEALDQAADGVPDENERVKLRQLKSEWQTGEKPPTAMPSERADALRDLNQQLSSGDDPVDTCQKLRALAGSASQSPTLLFNLAKCAEDEGNLDEASQLLDRYFALAPNAEEDKQVNEDLQTILALQQRAGPEVMKDYADADRFARMGRHKQAVLALEHAESQAPNLPDTQLRIARLLQGRGDVVHAREHYDKYLTLETDATQKAAIEQERAALDQRSKEYDEQVRSAGERLRLLLTRYVSDGRPMGNSAAQQELREIAEQLQRASLMVPLGTDVNLMLGDIYLHGGSYGAARKSLAAAWDAGSPVWFYGDVHGSSGWDNITSKVEISADEIKIIGLSKYDKKRKGNMPYLDAVNPDGVGGFLVPYAETEGMRNVVHISSAAIESVETNNDAVQLVWTERTDKSNASGTATKRDMTIHPLKVTVPRFLQGAAARKFANPYTRLFRDFGDRKVKLGAEHMTGGEKFGMAMSVAAAAYAGGGFAAMNGMSTTASRIAVAMRSVTWATIAVQSSLDAQARMLRQTDFKIIPIEDPKPEFRTDLFR